MKQNEYIAKLRIEAEAIPGLIKSKYSGYSSEQLNWKPDSKAWSIGEIYEHIIQTNNLYYTHLGEKLKNVSVINAGEFPVKHTFIGKYIMNAVSPGNIRKVKTFKVFAPAAGTTDISIYQKFLDQHDYLLKLINQSAETDINKIKIPSPASRLIKYNLGDVLGILVYHTLRHLEQIDRTAQLYKN